MSSLRWKSGTEESPGTHPAPTHRCPKPILHGLARFLRARERERESHAVRFDFQTLFSPVEFQYLFFEGCLQRKSTNIDNPEGRRSENIFTRENPFVFPFRTGNYYP